MLLPQLALWAAAGLTVTAAGPAAVPAPAVPATAVAAPSRVVVRKRVEEVRVVFSARDGRKLIRNLRCGQLSILDNGLAPAAVTSFQQESTLPLRVALVIDRSDSMQRGFVGEQQAARAFLERFLRPKIDSAFALDFAISASLLKVSHGDDFAPRAIDQLEASGQTALYDALLTAAHAFEQQSNDAAPARRVVILLSDGEDNYSRAALSDAVEALQRADVAVYALTAHSPRFEYRGDSVLRQMAEATGGRAFILKSYGGADRVFREIEGELRTQYSMTFRPPAPRVCGYHAIRIVPRDSKLRIHARDGYYACSD